MPELLLELLSEEIPARMQAQAAADLKRLVADRLTAAQLSFGSARAFVTPRRLALVLDGLPHRQPDLAEERKGPRVGAPEPAIAGFLRSVGLASLDQCEQRDTGKGVFWFANLRAEGRPTPAVLAELIPQVLRTFPWPKSMRWGSAAGITWVRPLQRILCLFDGRPVPFAFAGLESGATTVGHRFLAPEPFTVSGFADYRDRLRHARVLLDAAERSALIRDGAGRLAAAEGLLLEEDPGLVAEVTGLVEWPVVLLGAIDDAFMDVPPEVLTTAMRTHQKYFALHDPDGPLAPRFVIVANMEAEDGGRAIVAGNERVLRARLSDAKFFWDQDRRRSLESRVPALEQIVFHARLGTVGQKVERLQALAAELSPFVPGADIDRVRSAAFLCKADLTTGMVGEFPELQGVMGRYYALHEGERPEVADAIAEHYSPLGPGDRCPTAPVSVAVALADKIDTLVCFFAIGERPTGSKDPYALRRAALGVIRLVLENGLRLPLQRALGAAHALSAEVTGSPESDRPRVTAEVLEFFADRLKVHLRERGVRHDLISAVFALGGEDDLVRLQARVEALQAFLASDDGANLLTAYRRASNIVRIEERRDGQRHDGAVEPARLVQAEERALLAALDRAQDEIALALRDERYGHAMGVLAGLRPLVDAFFDRVTVNAEDAALRSNRLRLLSRIRSALGTVADFSRIEG